MIDRYRQMDLLTASPVLIVVKLYEGALCSARSARAHIEAGQILERIKAIDKVLAIVSELQSSLDFDQGGEIALQLHELYNFVTNQLLEANRSASTQAIDHAVNVLETLLEGWQQIALNPGAVSAAAAGATP